MRVLPVLLLAGVLFVALPLTPTAAAQSVEADQTRTHLELEEDGDAVFSLEVRTELDSDDERTAFEEYEEDVEENSSAYLEPFEADMRDLVDRVANATERGMDASDFSVDTRIEAVPRELGIVTYSFRWSGFAVVEDDVLRVDGVLGGYILDEGDSLEIAYPEGYAVDEVAPDPDSNATRSVRWDGPRDFMEDEPRLAVSPEATDSDGTDAGDDAEFPVAPVAILVLILALAGTLAYLAREHGSEDGGETAEDRLDVMEEAVPDSERVLTLIEDSGGKMKQKNIVEETGWSEAKVSQVTSNLEEEGSIRKLRMGRENVLEILEDKGEDGGLEGRR